MKASFLEINYLKTMVLPILFNNWVSMNSEKIFPKNFKFGRPLANKTSKCCNFLNFELNAGCLQFQALSPDES